MNLSRNAAALAAVCLAALMFGLEISSVPVILSTLERVLHADLADLQWIMNAYTIACTTVLMATGTLADRYGRRRVFVASLVLFGATSLLCGIAQNAAVLIAARFAQGVGGGAMLICLVAILSHQFREGRERSRAFAVFGVVFGMGLGFGPIVGGFIVAVSNWHWVFLVHAPLTVLTLALVYGGVAESRDPAAKTLDIAGIIALSLAVFGLTYAITQGPEHGFASPLALGAAVVAVAAFVIFVIVEKSAAHPMFDFSVFRIRAFAGAMLGAVGMNFSFWPFMIYLPMYFQGVLGYDAVAAGSALLAYTLPTLVMPPIAEKLSTRHGARRVIPAGLFLIGFGFFVMRLGLGGPGWLVLAGAFAAGTGLGLTNTPVTNAATASVSSDRAGMASGIDMSARLITLAVNIALMGVLLLAGVKSALSTLLPSMDAVALHALAGRVAAGDMGAAPEAKAALAQGFGGVMLYGAIGVWVLAGLAVVVFRTKNAQTLRQANGAL